MASSNGVIDEYGMLTNVLPNGLQLDMITSIKEFIDNSIDANANKLTIKFTKHPNINAIKLTIIDNGDGMDIAGRESFITLCQQNKDNSKNGFYGLGSIAALTTITLNNKALKGHRKTKVLTVSDKEDDKDGYGEVNIDWDFIENDHGNKKVWSENVRSDNVSRYNSKFLEDNMLLKDGGTYIETIVSHDFVDESKLNKLVFDLNRTYMDSLNTDTLTINISCEDIDIEYDKVLNKDSIVDLIHYDEIKHNSTPVDFGDKEFKPTKKNGDNLSCYCNYTISLDEDNNFKAELNDTNVINVRADDAIIYSDEDIHKTFNSVESFDYKATWISKKMLDIDTRKVKDALNSSSASWSAGVYFTRNGKILSKPIALDKIRTTQDKTRWRAICSYNTPIMASMVKPGINKSELKKDNIDTKLFMFLSKVTKQMVERCVSFISSNYKCKICSKSGDQCDCCKKCKHKIDVCVCPKCSSCNKLKSECECCKECKHIKCTCCSICNKGPKKCKCCNECAKSIKDCICCSNCALLECVCCHSCHSCHMAPDNCKCCKECSKFKEDCICCSNCDKSPKDCVCYKPCLKCPNNIIDCKCCDKCRKYNCLLCENPRCKKKKCKNECSCKNINGDWRTEEDYKVCRNGILEQYNAVYLIQPGEHWNTNIYKLGMTESQTINSNNSINRFEPPGYTEYTKIICFQEVENSKGLEKKLITKFKQQFDKIQNKKEYFRGDIKEMKRIFLETVVSHL